MPIRHVHIKLDEETFEKLEEIKDDRDWTWRDMLTINEGIIAKKDMEDIKDEEIIIAPPKGPSEETKKRFEEIAESVEE